MFSFPIIQTETTKMFIAGKIFIFNHIILTTQKNIAVKCIYKISDEGRGENEMHD